MTEAVLPTPYPLDYLRLGLLVTCSVSLLCTCQGTQHRGHGGISHTCSPPSCLLGSPLLHVLWPPVGLSEVHGRPLPSFLDHTGWMASQYPNHHNKKMFISKPPTHGKPPCHPTPAQGPPSPGVCAAQWLCGSGGSTMQTQGSQL